MRVQSIGIGLFAFFIMTQFSSQPNSTANKEKPHINIRGVLVDRNGDRYNVENITISGLYHQIPFYKKPYAPHVSPDSHITRIDLSELSEIRVPHENNQPYTSTHRNRDYITIDVILNDSKKTMNRYIIEKSRRILCDESSEAGPQEKDVSFEAIDRIIITDVTEQPPTVYYKEKI